MNVKQKKTNIIKPKKSLGQNFLKDKNTLEKIVSVKNISQKSVVEIGLGQGDLTRVLSSKAKEVTCYEIDKKLTEDYGYQFKDSNVQIINEDFLKSSFTWKDKKILVANIPYYITSDILFKIFDNYSKFSSCVIMMQEEVANRICAKVDSKEYGKLTVTTNFFANNIKKHFVVKPHLFFPAPKVNSAVISFDLKTNLKDLDVTKNFIKRIFAFRRKTIANNLKQFSLNYKEIEDIINKINQNIKKKNIQTNEININCRPQNLSIEQIFLLKNEFKKFI